MKSAKRPSRLEGIPHFTSPAFKAPASLKQRSRVPDIARWTMLSKGVVKAFSTFTIQQVPRAEKTHVDALASLGSELDTQFKSSIMVEHPDQPSIEEAEQPDLVQINEDLSWQDLIIDYLPREKSEARKIQ
ncbi:hypothetical protein L3X38_025269 [Prunus dulcis]|uniref:Uncharacterized protein n=1 Tax=Prunus dulcis TaxID=3755 RepID=A0AAD4Z766_PRUDU|nr:hypothetical protein L3X38_025269 [Prunus dulcis]